MLRLTLPLVYLTWVDVVAAFATPGFLLNILFQSCPGKQAELFCHRGLVHDTGLLSSAIQGPNTRFEGPGTARRQSASWCLFLIRQSRHARYGLIYRQLFETYSDWAEDMRRHDYPWAAHGRRPTSIQARTPWREAQVATIQAFWMHELGQAHRIRRRPVARQGIKRRESGKKQDVSPFAGAGMGPGVEVTPQDSLLVREQLFSCIRGCTYRTISSIRQTPGLWRDFVPVPHEGYPGWHSSQVPTWRTVCGP